MKKIVLLLSLFSSLVFADAVIFSGSDVKALKQNIDLNGVTKILSGTLDPRSGAGVVAPEGSVYLSKTSGLYNKTGPLDTAWTKISLVPVDLATSVSGILGIVNGGTGSNTKNFVDLSTNQTIAGTKTFSSPISGSITGNAATVTTNANLTGMVTSSGNATTVVTNANLTGDVTSVGNVTTYNGIVPVSKGGTGSATQNYVDLSTNQTIGGTKTFSSPISGSVTGNAATVTTNANLSGMVTSVGNATTVVTNANLSGEVTSVGNVTTVPTATVINKPLTGYTSSAGVVSSTDSIVQAIGKLNGNDAGTVRKADYTTAGGVLVADGVGSPVLKAVGTSDDMFLGVDNSSPDKTTWKKPPTENMLTNGSFDFYPSFQQGWTCSVGSTSADYGSVVPPSLASMKVTSIGAGVRCYQTVTANAANLLNQQGFVRIYVKSDDAALQVCALKDGFTSSFDTNCKTVAVTSVSQPFQLVEIPFIMGGTSNGIVIKSTTTTTQNIYLDEAVMAKGLPNNVKVPGDVVYSAKFANTSGVKTDENVAGWVNGNASITSNDATITFKTGQFSTAPNCLVTANSAVSESAQCETRNLTSTGVIVSCYDGGAVASRDFILSCQKTGTDYAIASGSGFAQENSNTNEVSYTPTFGPGWGTVTPSANQCQYSLVGGSLKGRCSVTMGTPTTGLYSITLPTGFSIDTTKITANNTTANPGQSVGKWLQSACKGDVVTATATSTSTVYLGSCSAPYLTPVATGAPFNTQLTDVTFEIPVIGRSNVFNMVGSFANMEKCANDYDCTDKFSAKVSASGVVSNSNLPWINGSCTQVGTTYTCTLLTILRDGVNPLSSPLNCNITVGEVANGFTYRATRTSTTQVVYHTNSNTPADQAQAVEINCQKGTNDYKPKTGKIADPTGIMRVPNSQNQSIKFISTNVGGGGAAGSCTTASCTLTNNYGFASFSRASAGRYNGVYSTPFTLFSSCTMTGAGNTATGNVPTIYVSGAGQTGTTTGTNTIAIYNGTVTPEDGSFTIFCWGI